jgi:hypothetical protein
MGVAADSRVEKLSQGIKPHAVLLLAPRLRIKLRHSPRLSLLLWLLLPL